MTEFVGRNAVANCARCGRRRQLGKNQSDLCRDCPPDKRWDEPLTEEDLGPIQWVRDGLVWRSA